MVRFVFHTAVMIGLLPGALLTIFSETVLILKLMCAAIIPMCSLSIPVVWQLLPRRRSLRGENGEFVWMEVDGTVKRSPQNPTPIWNADDLESAKF